ncbi:MAG TPA: hypothetical protein VHS31_03595 [Tepidisphaeraceae bacterium]|nr:hypothetical protein [Tepidisphaeraceae bacterium]
MTMLKSGWIRLMVLALSLALTASAFADLDGAKKALDAVKKDIADDSTSNIDSDVKLVEFELKDTPDADKKAIQDELDGIKKKLFDAKVAKYKPGYTDEINKYYDNAKRALADNDPDGAVREANSLDSYLLHQDITDLFSADEIAKYKQQMNKYRKMATDMQADRMVTGMTDEMTKMEADYAQKKNDLKTENEGQSQMITNGIADEINAFSSRLNALPADNDKVKALKARVDKMNADFATLASGQLAKNRLASLKSSWESYSNEYQGWETENSPPTFEQYGKGFGNTDMHAFGMPHSVALIRRVDDFTKNMNQDDSFKQIASQPDVKAFTDTIAKARADCYAKVLKAATAIVEQAEKTTFTNDNRGSLNTLPDDIRLALGENSPEGQALKARAQKLIDNYQAGLAAADKAFEDNYKNLCAAATKAWPDMAAKYSTVSGFDPNKYQDFKGKTIKISDTDNLMGWSFKTGDGFDFATKINGLPVAGRYNPVVKAAIADVEAKVKHGIGDIDQDGKWEIIATVDGNTGQMNTRQRETGDVRGTDGEKLGTVTSETSKTVDAPIITIIAAHCGPLAVSADQGAVNESGAVVTPAGAALGSGAASSSSGSGWMTRFLFLIIGLVAAAAALLKAGYAPIASLPQAGEVQAKLGGDNLAYIGLACAAWGLLWLLEGLIYRGFLLNIAVIAAGLYAALDFLAAKGIVKPDQVAKIKPLGVPIGLACAAIVVLGFLIGGRMVIL